MLLQQTSDGIWQETESPAFSPVLRSPNRYQNHIQFKEHWILSKLISGNTYALKGRDNRGVVTALYVLDPARVQVLIADDGSVYYELNTDSLAGLARPGDGAGERDHPRPLQLPVPPADRRQPAVRLGARRLGRQPHAGRPVGVLRQRRRAERHPHRAGRALAREGGAAEGAVEQRLHRHQQGQDRGAGRRHEVRGDQDDRGRLAAGRADEVQRRDDLLHLPRAELSRSAPAPSPPGRRSRT